jgi:hypothetical protein
MKRIFSPLMLVSSVLALSIVLPVSGSNAAVVLVGGSSVTAAGGSWNSHLPGLTSNCTGSLSSPTGTGFPYECRLVTWLPPVYGPLYIPAEMAYGNGAYETSTGSWEACDPNYQGSGSYVNECQQMSQVTDPQMQGYLGTFYAGYKVAETEDAFAGQEINLSGMQIGDGSIAALLIWEVNTGDYGDANSTYMNYLRPVMVETRAFVDANSPYTCSGVDGGKTVSASIFSACFVWNEAYAAANDYLNSEQIDPECKIIGPGSIEASFGSVHKCETEFEFSLFHLNRYFWDGIYTPGAPQATYFADLSTQTAEFDCAYSPMNWLTLGTLTAEAGSAFPSSSPANFDPQTPGDLWSLITIAVNNLSGQPAIPNGLPSTSPADSCSQ